MFFVFVCACNEWIKDHRECIYITWIILASLDRTFGDWLGMVITHGCAQAGCAQAGCAQTECAQTECAQTECAQTECAQTGCAQTGCAQTGCAQTMRVLLLLYFLLNSNM